MWLMMFNAIIVLYPVTECTLSCQKLIYSMYSRITPNHSNGHQIYMQSTVYKPALPLIKQSIAIYIINNRVG